MQTIIYDEAATLSEADLDKAMSMIPDNPPQVFYTPARLANRFKMLAMKLKIGELLCH